MPETVPITSSVSVAPQLRAEDLAGLAAAGFRTIVNNRPDGEEPGQPPSAEIEAEARRVGLAYRHIPVAPAAMSEREIRAFAEALDEAERPVLAFCRSGARSAHLCRAAAQLQGRE